MIEIKNAPPIPGLHFRHFQGDSDYAQMAAVITASQAADHVERNVRAEDLANAYQHMNNCDPFKDMIVAEVFGKIVGYVRGWWDEDGDSGRIYHHNGFLIPEWRRKGIGHAMLIWMESRLAELANSCPGNQRCFQVNVSQFQVGTASLLESTGYQPVRYFFEMVRPNLDNIPDFSLPDGLEIRPVTPDQYRIVWESTLGAYEEEWGLGVPTEDKYEEWLISPLFQPHLWQIAWDTATGQTAGHVLTYIHYEENKQFHRKRGYTEGVGVSRDWRRRGVARALICQSLQAQKAAGMDESALVADKDSASGVTSLYESCGFQIVKCDTIYRKPL
ncbi:MAG: GNAT family N-acetyltransferase [Anaerolineales bacterium]|jgi:ribosomal protein S18 acetylase RimI-like enzyme|nr:GNAT family N-acetyltransferase [Anaerolineales bacterium]